MSAGRKKAAAGTSVGHTRLVGYWKFDEPAGNVALDSSGRGHNGVILNGTRVPGVVGQGLQCNGLGSGVDIADVPDFETTGSLAIMGWVKITLQPDYRTLIFFRGDNRPGLDPYTLGVEKDGTILFQIQDSANQSDSVGAPAPLHRFFHVAGMYDSHARTLSLYLDGKKVASKKTEIVPMAGLLPQYRSGVGICHHAMRAWGDYGFDGVVDEIKLYAEPLKAIDVSLDYKASGAIMQIKKD